MNRWSCFSLCCAVAALLVCAPGAPAAQHYVSTAWELNTVMAGLGPGDEVILAPGTYDLDTYGHTYGISVPNVTIRGQTGNRDDVVIWGGGMNNSSGIHEGLQIYGDDVTIRDLTLEGFYHHAIHFQPGAYRTHVDNVRTLNIGQQHMKGGASQANAVVGSIVENCLMEQNIPRTSHPILNYTGGLDLLGATDWIIRNNVAMGISGETAEGGGAIFLWQKIVNPTVEGNVVIGCDRGIAMGNPGYQGADNLVGGIVCNNFVSHSSEINLELIATTDLKVCNNTLYGPSGSGYSRCVSMEGHVTSGLELKNNLIYGDIADRGIPFVSANNITGTTADASWFVGAANGDLHLTPLALAAIDAGQPLADVMADIDGDARPYGPGCDIGADEWVPEPATLALLALGACLPLRRRRS